MNEYLEIYEYLLNERKPNIKYQEASLDVWDQKYRLKNHNEENIDVTIEDNYYRVAKRLASVEKPENVEFFTKLFYLAMSFGAVPAGRIMSNAGAEHQKPGTSLINCVVSGTIDDSISDILQKLKESGETLSTGSGIGYDFSTLRPKDSYVDGAGAKTSGSLSFMDIYDKMCFTISSAGGRRGAQMATMDIRHPDIFDFIKAKREAGRFRQFNLSVLLTSEFIESVKNNDDIDLIFPINKSAFKHLNNFSEKLLDDLESFSLILKDYWKEDTKIVFDYFPTGNKENYFFNKEGKVLCKVYKTVNSNTLWDTIMTSTYNFAEPGFIMIDKMNYFNNNWFIENIRATNPCVVGDTLVITKEGQKPIRELVDKTIEIWNGFEWSEVTPRVTGEYQEVYDVLFSNGAILTCTGGHKFILSDNSRLTTIEVKPGYKLQDWSFPTDFSLDLPTTTSVEITSIVKKPNLEPFVYCFTDQKNNSGVFNGIMTANCGEQGLPPYGACLLGSINLTVFVNMPFTEEATFDYYLFSRIAKVMTRMLDNVADIGNMSLSNQIHELNYKRRHGLGYFGLGSSMAMLRIKYGSKESIDFTSNVTRILAISSWEEGHKLAVEKGPAPIMNDWFTITDEHVSKMPNILEEYKVGDRVQGKVLIFGYSKYMENIYNACPENNKIKSLKERLITDGCRFTHATSIAPTGTISLSYGNNASNGIEPSFAHHYKRNIIIPGKNCKESIDVYSYELLLYKELVNPNADPYSDGENALPDYFISSETITPKNHVDIQSAAQKYIDSSISKCVAIGTKIHTNKGLLPIEDLEKDKESKNEFTDPLDDLYVLQETGVYKKVTKFYYDGYRPTWVLTFNNGFVLETSFTHKLRDINYNWITVDELNKGDFVLVSSPLSFDSIGKYEINGIGNLSSLQIVNKYKSYNHLYDITVEDTNSYIIDAGILSHNTINIPTDYPYDDFKDVYLYAYEKDLKGVATFRFNPEFFQGVLVTQDNLDNTNYNFVSDTGENITLKGSDIVIYNGQESTAANLYDSLKEGYYGKF